MPIPNCQHIVAQLAAQYPDEWRKAHNPSGGGPETEAFIRRLAYVLHTTVDARWGLNGKRGSPNDISDDALNWRGEGPGHDPTNGNQPITVVDVIAGAGGPNPQPSWQVFDTLPGPGAWVKPEPVGSGSGGGGTPPPTPPQPTAQDLLSAITALASQVKTLDVKVATVGDLVLRYGAKTEAAAFESLNAASRASEIKTMIENLPTPGEPSAFPPYEGRIFGARVRLEPK